jgi:hypothetical protein
MYQSPNDDPFSKADWEWLEAVRGEGMQQVYTLNLPIGLRTPDYFMMEHLLENNAYLKEQLLQVLRSHWLPFAYYQLFTQPGCTVPAGAQTRTMRTSIASAIEVLECRIRSLQSLAAVVAASTPTIAHPQQQEQYREVA